MARREDLTAAAAATLERSAGTVAHGTRAARERRRRRAKVSRVRRAGRARPARFVRRARPQRDSNGLGTWDPRQEAPALYLELASQNLGKYHLIINSTAKHPLVALHL